MFEDDGYRLIPSVGAFVEDNRVQLKVLENVRNVKIFKNIKRLKTEASRKWLKTKLLNKRTRLIDECKREFIREFYSVKNKKHRIYNHLKNKEIFVYQQCSGRKERLTITSIESLLSDRETIFSSEYSAYLVNHDTMVKWSKSVSAMGLDELCISVSLDFAHNLRMEWKAPFKDTLEQLMKRAHREKKPLMVYYNQLYDFYSRTEDAEKLVALNLLVQCNQPDFDTGLNPDDIITYLLDVSDQCRKWEEDNEKSFPEFASEEVYRSFVSVAMLGRVSPILNDVSDQFLERMQRERKRATEYDALLSDAYKKAKSKISSAVLDKIREWYPDTRIPVNAAIYFLRHVLENCARRERDIKAMKGLMGAGHFSPTYTAQDVQKAKIYIARKDQLRSLRKKLEPWIKTHEFPFYRETFGVEGRNCKEVRIPDEKLSKIMIHLSDYIVNSGYKIHEFSTDSIHKIINQLFDNHVIDEQVK